MTSIESLILERFQGGNIPRGGMTALAKEIGVSRQRISQVVKALNSPPQIPVRPLSPPVKKVPLCSPPKRSPISSSFIKKPLDPALKQSRFHLQQMLFRWKEQLLLAYVSGDERRITKAKISYLRIIKEISESPELGPPPPFRWGKLEIVYRGGFDPHISWEACEQTLGDWKQIARLLEGSISYV